MSAKPYDERNKKGLDATMELTRPVIVAIGLFFTSASIVSAQVAPAGQVPASAPVAVAVRMSEPPQLDGEVLNDPAWASVNPVAGFWQTTPNEGQPASERTEVRIAYTADTIYFGIVCYDGDPSGIIVADSRRDASLGETDSFQIILDTYRDRQNGFVFGTNPAGIEYDGQVVNEGNFNVNWDGAWQVRTRVTEIGWTAEIALPLRTLRYPSGSEQIWGMNFQRNIRRRNETSFWAPLTRQYNLYRLALAGQLRGLEVPAQRNLKLVPYVLGESRSVGAGASTTALGDFGLDLKYSITPSVTLDVTYNTDFAQVEVDDQQVNLDRFNLFFPEKRPFFLENSGLFAVGTARQTEIFFSRRIGIGPGGREIPIVGGARVTGNVGGYSIGLLNMQTDDLGNITPANNFSVARLRRDLPNRSYFGGMFVNRQATGASVGTDNYNRAFALDGRWGLGRNGFVQGYLAKTATPGLRESTHAYNLFSQYNSQEWRLAVGYTEVGERFNPEAGFLERKAFRAADVQVYRTIRLGPSRILHEIRPHVSFDGFWNLEGFFETGRTHIDTHWEWKNASEVHTGLNLTRQGVTAPFEIFPGIIVPPGGYDHHEAQIVTFTNQGAPVSFDLRTTAGGFFGGHRVQITPRIRLRLGETFNSDVSLSRNDIELPGGRFKTNLIRTRLSYSFTPRVFLQTLLQYNDRADLWSTNIRFGWQQDANTGLFIVYADTRELGAYDFITATPGRSLTLKFSRIFDVLR